MANHCGVKMKKKYPPIVDQWMAHLLPHGPITVRAMFGGFGIFYDRVIFAIIIKNELYFRIDDQSRSDFESLGCRQFIYNGMSRPVTMPYFTLPNAILKNSKKLKEWIERAYLASLSSKKSKRRAKSLEATP
jgi:DNA transformation protein and related proteins